MGGDPVYIDAVYAAFSPRTGTTQFEPVWADPCDASATLKNSADIKGKIALIARGKVDWFDKVKHAENAGAVGVVFVNTEDSLDPLPVAGNPRLKSKIPCIMVTKNALNTPRLFKKTFGRAPLPTHSNPDGPSACSIFPATLGYSSVCFRSSFPGGVESQHMRGQEGRRRSTSPPAPPGWRGVRP